MGHTIRHYYESVQFTDLYAHVYDVDDSRKNDEFEELFIFSCGFNQNNDNTVYDHTHAEMQRCLLKNATCSGSQNEKTPYAGVPSKKLPMPPVKPRPKIAMLLLLCGLHDFKVVHKRRTPKLFHQQGGSGCTGDRMQLLSYRKGDCIVNALLKASLLSLAERVGFWCFSTTLSKGINLNADTQPSHRPDRLLRLPSILERVHVSRSLWWRWCKEGHAPKGIKLSARVTAWRESDIDAFVERLAAGQ